MRLEGLFGPRSFVSRTGGEGNWRVGSHELHHGRLNEDRSRKVAHANTRFLASGKDNVARPEKGLERGTSQRHVGDARKGYLATRAREETIRHDDATGSYGDVTGQPRDEGHENKQQDTHRNGGPENESHPRLGKEVIGEASRPHSEQENKNGSDQNTSVPSNASDRVLGSDLFRKGDESRFPSTYHAPLIP